MPDNPAKEAFNDILIYLENVETQTGALLQFLRDNGTVTDEKLAPYLEQASKASDVRLRAARARIDYLFSADEISKPATEAIPSPPRKEAEGPAAAAHQKEASEQPQPADPKNEGEKKDAAPADSAVAEKANNGSRTVEVLEGTDSGPKTSDTNEPSEIVSAGVTGREISKKKAEESPVKSDVPPQRDAA